MHCPMYIGERQDRGELSLAGGCVRSRPDRWSTSTCCVPPPASEQDPTTLQELGREHSSVSTPVPCLKRQSQMRRQHKHPPLRQLLLCSPVYVTSCRDAVYVVESLQGNLEPLTCKYRAIVSCSAVPENVPSIQYNIQRQRLDEFRYQ